MQIENDCLISVLSTDIVYKADYSGRTRAICPIPVNVTSIGEYAFTKCINMTHITLPMGVKEIGEGAFFALKSLIQIDLPEGLTTINASAFMGCMSIERLRLPRGLNLIAEKAFAFCKGLKEITLPASIKIINKDAFLKCTSITSIKIETENPDEFNRIKRLLPQTLWAMVIGINTVAPSIATPTSMGNNKASSSTQASSSAVSKEKKSENPNCKKGCLKKIDPNAIIDGRYLFPEGIKKIGENAFLCNSDLVEIHLPIEVTEIGKCAFAGCTNLNKITLHKNIRRIGNGAFRSCDVTIYIVAENLDEFNRLKALVVKSEKEDSSSPYRKGHIEYTHSTNNTHPHSEIGENTFSSSNRSPSPYIPPNIAAPDSSSEMFSFGYPSYIPPSIASLSDSDSDSDSDSLSTIGINTFFPSRSNHSPYIFPNIDDFDSDSDSDSTPSRV